MQQDDKIYVAGGNGLVGSAIVRQLHQKGYHHIVLRSHQELDLSRQADVEEFFKNEKPDYVIDAAALVGGIRANEAAPADFLYINLQIQNNLIHAAFRQGVKKFLFLGSACMYPKVCEQPMREELLLTGLSEQTNEGYALAKVCGSRLCSYLHRQHGAPFVSAIPANTYGLNDRFDPINSHVIPALMMKYHRAKEEQMPTVDLWGTGKPLREFIYADDIADGCIFLLNHYNGEEPVNIGTGEEISMFDLSRLIGEVVGYQGEIITDPSRPDGMMRRMLDSSKLRNMGWMPKVPLREGLTRLYQWYLENCVNRK